MSKRMHFVLSHFEVDVQITNNGAHSADWCLCVLTIHRKLQTAAEYRDHLHIINLRPSLTPDSFVKYLAMA